MQLDGMVQDVNMLAATRTRLQVAVDDGTATEVEQAQLPSIVTTLHMRLAGLIGGMSELIPQPTMEVFMADLNESFQGDNVAHHLVYEAYLAFQQTMSNLAVRVAEERARRQAGNEM